MREYYKFCQNKQCEYFPCHKGVPEEDFNCLFCYCPLYALGKVCGGEYTYDNEWGIKDCSNCRLPHERENYDYIIDRAGELVDKMKLPPGEEK